MFIRSDVTVAINFAFASLIIIYLFIDPVGMLQREYPFAISLAWQI